MFIYRKAWLCVYGDGDDDSTSDSTSDSTGDGDAPTLKGLIEEHGLQDQLNTMMSQNRKGLTQKNRDLVQQLEKLQGQTSTSSQEKDELQAQIEELQSQYLSKSELAKRDADKVSKEHTKVLDNLTGESSKWKSLYEVQTVQRALLDAATQSEAIQAGQIVSMLEQSTSVVEVADSTGVGTGKYQPVVKFRDTNEAGESITVELSPIDAVNRMKELTSLYGNLFKGASTSGLGSAGGASSMSEGKRSDILSNPAAYREWRKKNPDLDISKMR